MNSENNQNISIKFERNFSMKNGNKITKKNWHKVVAVSTEPCTNVHGVKEIDRQIKENGVYFEKWALRYEEANGIFESGFIFREINHDGGINGRHKTAKEAIWHAIKSYIIVGLEE